MEQGYSGPLCGECRSAYGHTTSLDCDRCDKNLSIAYLVLSVVVVFALSSFAIKSSLGPALSNGQDIAKLLRPVPARKLIRTISVPEELQLSERNSPLSSVDGSRQQAIEVAANTGSEEDHQLSAELAKWKIAEIFKARAASAPLSMQTSVSRSPSTSCR